MSKASEIRVVRSEDAVKLKLRTPELLYTYKTSSSEADDLLKSAKDLEVVELTPISEKKKKSAEADSSKKAENEATTTTEGEKAPQKSRSAKKRK